MALMKFVFSPVMLNVALPIKWAPAKYHPSTAQKNMRQFVHVMATHMAMLVKPALLANLLQAKANVTPHQKHVAHVEVVHVQALMSSVTSKAVPTVVALMLVALVK